MTSDSSSLPVEILDLILLIILPDSPGLVGLSWPVLSLLRSVLRLLDMIMISVLLKPILGHLGHHLGHLLAVSSGRPGLLGHWTEV